MPPPSGAFAGNIRASATPAAITAADWTGSTSRRSSTSSMATSPKASHFCWPPQARQILGCLDWAIAVAIGGVAFGAIKCEVGDVLYAALEDNPRRLQRRMRQVCPVATSHTASPSGRRCHGSTPAGSTRSVPGSMPQTSPPSHNRRLRPGPAGEEGQRNSVRRGLSGGGRTAVLGHGDGRRNRDRRRTSGKWMLRIRSTL